MGNEFGDGVFLGESSSSLRIEIAESDDLEEIGSGLISLDMLSADTGTDNDDSEGSDHGKKEEATEYFLGVPKSYMIYGQVAFLPYALPFHPHPHEWRYRTYGP
jgi:hypothetical protein